LSGNLRPPAADPEEFRFGLRRPSVVEREIHAEPPSRWERSFPFGIATWLFGIELGTERQLHAQISDSIVSAA